MNLMKSIFVSNYMMAAMALAGYSAWMIYQNGNAYAWIGVALTTWPLMLLVTYLMILRNTPRTSAHLPWLSLLAAVGIALAGWAGIVSRELLPFGLALGGLVGLLLFSFWYSEFGRTLSQKLRVGTTLPEITLTDVQGNSISSRQWLGQPSILIFYRGNWCPLCMAQVKELVAHYKQIEQLGVRVALISPQPHDNTVRLAKQHSVAFDFLTDEGNLAARTLGIDIDHGLPLGMQMFGYDSETVLPTVVILNSEGEIVWTHETDNYRIRPEPSLYLDILRDRGLIASHS